MPKVTLVCAHCRQEFKAYASEVGRKFCSMACMRAKEAATDVALTCEQCSGEFTVKPSYAKRGPRFCCQQCKNNSVPPVSRPCATCGEFVTRPPSLMVGTTFCSRACKDAEGLGSAKCPWPGCTHTANARSYMRKERDGSRSVVYKTERTREGRYTRYPLCDYHMTLIRKRLGDSTRFSGSRGTVLADPDHEYDGRFVSSRFLRLVVFERQGGKCGCCGKRLRWDAPPKQWEIDHVVPIFRGGKTRLDHLMALCKKCHDDKTALEKSEVTKARWTAGLRWMTHYEKNLLIDDLLKEIADFKQQVAHLTAQG